MLKRLLRNLGAAASSKTARNPLLDYAEGNPNGLGMEKWVHYFDVYHRHFQRFRGRKMTIIEIGILNGGSLRMWQKYFGSQATVVGVDVNPECARLAAPGIEIVIGDQGDRSFLRELRDRYPLPAILLDDGGHTMNQQIATFEELYPSLDPEGIFVCEDTHTSYWPDFGGGLRRDGTFIEMAKTLIDRINAQHVLDESFPVDDFTVSTGSLHFYDSILVIERTKRARPVWLSYGSQRILRVHS